MQKSNIFLIQIIIMSCGLFASARAQDTIVISVFGNGVSISQTGNHRLSATLGQPLIGVGSNDSITIYGGFWTSIIDIATSTEQIEESTLPQEFSLNQNYPNPFNPTTIISWQLPVSGHVSLKVYDIIGNEVATLVNEEKPAGNYEISFDASGLSSGVYFYKLTSGNFIKTKKMILLR
jgi:hypothetical protein